MVAADDMYGSVPSREQERAYDRASSPSYTVSQDYSTQYTQDYYSEPNPADTFNYDDYYDYEYTSRLRRFHNDDYVSDDYYSDYYTNSYWYDRDPYYYGTSIYLGYNWWYPAYSYYYRPGWYIDWNWGWRYGWSGYYSYGPHYGWGWNSYAWGWNDGYWNGYRDGFFDHYWGDRFHDYCYNPYDRNTYTQSQYGKRISGGSSLNRPAVTTGGAVRTGTAQGSSLGSSTQTASTRRVSRPSFAERYESAVSASSTIRTSGAGTEKLDSKPRTSESVRPSAMIDKVSTRLNSKQVSVSSAVKPATRPAVSTPSRVPNSQSTTVRSSQSGYARPTNSQSVPVRTSPSTPVRTTQGTSTSRPQSTATPTRTGSQAAPQRTTTNYQRPVYNSNRSSSSYTSPRYNNSSSTRSSQSTPARNTSTVRTTSSTPVRSSSSSVSRSSGSSGSSGSSSSSSSSGRRR